MKGIRSSPASRIVSRRRSRVLRGRSLVRDEIGVHATRASAPARRSPDAGARARRGSRSPTFVCGSMPRSSARSQAQVTYDTKSSWPYSRKPRCDLGMDLRLLAGQHQQLLHPPPRRVVEHPLHLTGRVQVRPVGRERAVLAEAPARARQRQREVAREGDPAHRARVYDPRRTGPSRPARAPPGPWPPGP